MAWLVKIDKNGTKYFADNKCRKCCGTGYIHGYEHIDGARCWNCGTTGKEKEYHWKEYTPEYAAKLAERRRAKAIKEAPESNRKWFKKHGFDINGRAWVVLGNTFDIKDDLKAAGAKFDTVFGWHFDRPDNGFNCFEISIEDIGEKTDTGAWNFKDLCEIDDFISRKQAEHAPQSKSEHIGSVGEKVTLSVEFIAVFSYETHFTYYGETNYIYKFADENGNCLVWKTTAFHDLTEGSKYTLKGTVKEHSEYKGEKQTTLKGCRISQIIETA